MVLQTSTLKIREGLQQAPIQSRKEKKNQINDNWLYNKANEN